MLENAVSGRTYRESHDAWRLAPHILDKREYLFATSGLVPTHTPCSASEKDWVSFSPFKPPRMYFV